MESYRTHPSNRGFTVIEMVMVVVLVGVLMSVSLPFFRNTTAKGSVRGAMDAISSQHAVARATAIQRGRIARLVLLASSNTALVTANKAVGSGVDTIGKVEDLGTRFNVSFTTTRDSVTFTPRGIGSDLTGTTIIVTRGTFSDTITISAAGRLTR